MPSLQIPDMPPDLYEILSHRAQREGRSLAQQVIADLRRVPECEARQRRMETIERLRSRLGHRATPLTPPEFLIRDRDH